MSMDVSWLLFLFLENAFDNGGDGGGGFHKIDIRKGWLDFIWTHPLDGCRKQLPHCPSSQNPN
jgi:hypothetical protein